MKSLRDIFCTICAAFCMLTLLSGQQAAASAIMGFVSSDVSTPGGITGDVSKPQVCIAWYESTLMSREVLKDADLSELDLPDELYVRIDSEDDSYFDYVAVQWDMDLLDIHVPGTYILTCRWIAEDMDIDTDRSIVPEMPVRVYDGPEPLRLPDFVENNGTVARYVFDGVTLFDCDDIRVYRSLDGGPFELMEGEFEYGYIATQEVMVSAGQLGYADMVFKLFNLDKDKVYSYMVEVDGGVHAGMSNAVLVAAEMPEVPQPPDGSPNDDVDGGNSGKRGGGGRYGTASREENIEITKKMMRNFIGLNPVQTMLELNGIRVVVPADVMQGLMDRTVKAADLALESVGEGVYALKLTVDGTLVDSFDGAITVYLPYAAESDEEWDDIKVLCNGQAVEFTDDRDAELLAVSAMKTGVYEIKAGGEEPAENSYWNGAWEWIKYWWLTMIGISLK